MGGVFSAPESSDDEPSPRARTDRAPPGSPVVSEGVESDVLDACVDACTKETPVGTQNLIRVGDSLWVGWTSETTRCPCVARVLDLTAAAATEVRQAIAHEDDRDSIRWAAHAGERTLIDSAHNPANFTRAIQRALAAKTPVLHIGTTGALTGAVGGS
jgi:hypothetical protein